MMDDSTRARSSAYQRDVISQTPQRDHLLARDQLLAHAYMNANHTLVSRP